MAIGLNFRVFRRNTKNLILLWNSANLPSAEDASGHSIMAFLVDTETDAGRPLKFSSFVPDNPDKFATDVSGIVISHSQNGIDPSIPCVVRVVVGDGDDAVDMTKEVMPANSVSEPSRQAPESHRRVYMYAKDYSSGMWVPWPSSGVIPSNISFSITDKEQQ